MIAATVGVHLAAAALLGEAVRRFGGCGLILHTHSARRRLRELGGDEGRNHTRVADDWMAGRGIRNPSRMAAICAPTRWCSPDSHDSRGPFAVTPRGGVISGPG